MIKIEWDLSDLEGFAKELTQEYEIQTALMTATQNIARVLHEEIKKRTPIDTGNLRKMWSAGENLKFTVTPVGNGYEVVLINEAINKKYPSDLYPDGFMYGVAVNDGHYATNGRWVQGRFFVQASVVKVSESKQLEDVIFKELEKWWDSL